MDESSLSIPDNHVIEVPSFGKAPAMRLEMENIRTAERRIIEAKTVNPSTYSELEHVYNEAYRDLKRHVSTLGYQLAMANKALEEAKADVILGSYAEFLKDKPKYHNNSNLRDAFFVKDEAYSAAYDRVAQLTALESNLQGKIKVFENVCKYMRQKIYLISKSGLADSNLYVTSGRKL
jgi:hypothetical protein